MRQIQEKRGRFTRWKSDPATDRTLARSSALVVALLLVFATVPALASAAPPTATTEAATNVRASSAQLNGTVNPEGASTSYYFEYGETTSYGTKIPASPESVGSGTSNVPVGNVVTGLSQSTTYHFRVVAEGGGVTVPGKDTTFKTEELSVASHLGSMSVTDPFDASASSLADFESNFATLGWAVGSTPKGQDTSTGWGPKDLFSIGLNGTYYSPSLSDVGWGLAAVVKMNVGPGSERYFSLWLDMPSPSSTAAGYELRFTNTSTNTYTVVLSKWVGGTQTELASKAGYSFKNGNSFAILDEGSMVAAWTDTGSGFTQLLSAADTTFEGGRVGLSGAGNNTRLNNFKASALRAPRTTTEAATSVKDTSATMNGTVNPEGLASSYYFEYGKSTSYSSKTSSGSAGSGTSNVAVNQTPSGLSSSTTYHYRLVAESEAGKNYGIDKTFQTLPDTTITGGSSGKVTPDVSFAFSSSQEGSTFECAVDAGSYSSCSSPKSYEGLTEGSHTFKVRAVGPGGADPTPAERTVEVREVAQAVSSVAVLDDFGRKEVPLKSSNWTKANWAAEIGGSWTSPWHGYGANGSVLASAYWNPTTFSDSTDGLLVSATLGTGPISKVESGEYLSLWLDMPSPGSARSGYEARFTGTNGTSSGYKVELSKWASGTRTVLATKESFSLSVNTTFALTATGGSLTIWTGTTSFSRVLTAYDATYSSGYAGIEANKGEGTAYDFRAGNMVPPSKPTVTSVVPGSPANNNSPSLIGSATAGSTVQLFTNSSCSGSPVTSGSAAAFGSTGIAASVADNSTTTFYAMATNGGGSSQCSTTSVTYVEDSIAPTAPTVSSTSPASGSNDNAPKVIGSAESGSTVKLYTNATCTSAVAATGTAAAFASPGLTVSVTDNTTTTFYATATDAAGNVSACSSTGVTYVEATPKVYWGAWLGGNAYSTGEKTYGDGPWDSETWNLFEKHAGKKISIEHFGQPAPWNQAFAKEPLNLARERGAIPMMDMDPDGVTLKEIVEGKKDSDFKTWAKAVKEWGYPMFFRWTWEMNGTWFQWGKEAAANPTLYKEAWWHLHDIIEEQGASNVTWVWCPNLTFSGSTSLSSLYPANESEGKGKYVDWTCLDGYNFGKNPKKPDSWKSFSTLYTSSYNELLTLAPTKPVMIGEMSSTEYGGSKASWITDAIGTQIPENFPKIKAVVWYNKWDGELDWPIETSSSSESAFASAISSTYYAGNTFGSLPTLTKVEPLP